MKSLHILKKAPWLAAIALGLGLSCISSGFAVGTENNKVTATKPSVTKVTEESIKKNKKAASFLFVVSADKAKITHLKDGQV